VLLAEPHPFSKWNQHRPRFLILDGQLQSKCRLAAAMLEIQPIRAAFLARIDPRSCNVQNSENPIGGAVPPSDPDAHLQRLLPRQNLDLPWYRSLYHNLKDLVHAPRLPPLEITSRPVVVKDIWGLYGRQTKSFFLSTGFQIALVGVVVLVGLTKPRIPIQVIPGIKLFFDTAAEVPRSVPQTHHAGGGGGDGSVLPANRGQLASMKPRKFVPPNRPSNPNPVITMDGNITGPLWLTNARPEEIGDPFGAIGPPSGGPGHGGGRGSGCCGGQGPGDGQGSGPGDGDGGFNNPIYVAGHSGLVNPVVLFKPEPDYSEDARKAKLQGTVLLEAVVGADGRTQIRKVLQSLGLGLDQQAIQAVSTWRFKPGLKDGKPVPVLINISVSFRLL